MEDSKVLSIISIILGIIIMIFPIFGVTTVSIILGITFLIMGIFTAIFSY